MEGTRGMIFLRSTRAPSSRRTRFGLNGEASQVVEKRGAEGEARRTGKRVILPRLSEPWLELQVSVGIENLTKIDQQC